MLRAQSRTNSWPSAVWSGTVTPCRTTLPALASVATGAMTILLGSGAVMLAPRVSARSVLLCRSCLGRSHCHLDWRSLIDLRCYRRGQPCYLLAVASLIVLLEVVAAIAHIELIRREG